MKIIQSLLIFPFQVVAVFSQGYIAYLKAIVGHHIRADCLQNRMQFRCMRLRSSYAIHERARRRNTHNMLAATYYLDLP